MSKSKIYSREPYYFLNAYVCDSFDLFVGDPIDYVVMVNSLTDDLGPIFACRNPPPVS